jgi:hypothetical protein
MSKESKVVSSTRAVTLSHQKSMAHRAANAMSIPGLVRFLHVIRKHLVMFLPPGLRIAKLRSSGLETGCIFHARIAVNTSQGCTTF